MGDAPVLAPLAAERGFREGKPWGDGEDGKWLLGTCSPCSSSSSSAGDAARKEIEVGLLHGLSLKKGLGEGLLLQLRRCRGGCQHAPLVMLQQQGALLLSFLLFFFFLLLSSSLLSLFPLSLAQNMENEWGEGVCL
jgi:hypothetical protein